MPFQAFILFSTFFWVANVIGQTRTLIGKVVDQELRPFHGVKVFNADTSLLTTCDVNGNFSLTISYNTKSLLIASIGMEWKALIYLIVVVILKLYYFQAGRSIL